MFKKKKDQLYQLIKKESKEHNTSTLFAFLDQSALIGLALCSKKYYLLLHPLLIHRQLDSHDKTVQKNKTYEKKKKDRNIKKSAEKKKTETQEDMLKQTEVIVTSVPLSKASKDIKNKKWTKIDKLPYSNSYLQKKINQGIYFFYQEENTGQIIFLNRSMIDPKLNYDMGGFDSDQQNGNKINIYEQMFEGEFSDLDFLSQQSLMNRQKQILKKIEQKKEEIKKMDEISYEEQLQKMAAVKKVAVILCFGGSFSLGIFENGRCVKHKSDKKYVCRKKAGQRQLNRDKQSGSQIKSMGSQIRRDQEKKHIANVYEILTENKQAIESCDLVFLQAPGLNRLFIINDSETLSGVKNRLRSVCITAKKANFTQVESLYTEITKISFVAPK